MAVDSQTALAHARSSVAEILADERLLARRDHHRARQLTRRVLAPGIPRGRSHARRRGRGGRPRRRRAPPHARGRPRRDDSSPTRVGWPREGASCASSSTPCPWSRRRSSTPSGTDTSSTSRCSRRFPCWPGTASRSRGRRSSTSTAAVSASPRPAPRSPRRSTPPSSGSSRGSARPDWTASRASRPSVPRGARTAEAFRAHLQQLRRDGRRVAGYGAPSKATVLLALARRGRRPPPLHGGPLAGQARLSGARCGRAHPAGRATCWSTAPTTSSSSPGTSPTRSRASSPAWPRVRGGRPGSGLPCRPCESSATA